MIISFLRAYIIFFLLFAGVADLGYAQAGPELGAGNTAPQTSETNRPLIITPAFHYGFIIAHHADMLFLTQGHVKISEICLTHPTHGEKYWNQLFKFPEPGISFCFFDLGNPQYLGNLYSICPYIDFPMTKGLRSKICFRAGGGLSYLTKPFDRVTNYKNIAIGSHVNGFMNFRLTLKQEITSRLRLDMGVGMSHCSNGAFKVPNLGLNMPTVDLGLGYSLNPCPQHIRMDTLPKCDKAKFFSVSIAGALSQINPPGGHDFAAVILSGSINRRWNHKNLWNAGIEVFYNEANYREIARTDASVTRARYIQPAAKIGYALCVGRMSMPLEMGVYFYDRVAGESVPIYERIGLKYQINDQFLIGTCLKVYFARAEFFEWGITYRFKHSAS
jgi:hypothetical protein